MPLPDNTVNEMIAQTIDANREMSAKLDTMIKYENDTGSYTLEGGTIAVIASLLEVNASLLSGLSAENKLIIDRMVEFNKKLDDLK